MLPVISRGLNLKPTCRRKNHAHGRALTSILDTLGTDPETGCPFAVSWHRLQSVILARMVQIYCICNAGHGFDADESSGLSRGRRRLPDHGYRVLRAERISICLSAAVMEKPARRLAGRRIRARETKRFRTLLRSRRPQQSAEAAILPRKQLNFSCLIITQSLFAGIG
jgi:hypothetical protein